ncbi:MAG: dipeptide epimerase [Verrucomicrobiota bacterium]|nr:dipeptide epimerase [Limisphaera sp.]MDW8382121.1 dipeptide epimerase [Verrucomicrobiota bacterium]
MELRFDRCDLRLADPWQIANAAVTCTQAVWILQLKDREGTVGWGEASPAPRYGEDMEAVATFLRRVDPNRLSFEDLDASAQYLDSLGRAPLAARCALDVALWDGAARKRSIPLHDLPGWGFIEGRYLSSFTLGIDTPQNVRRKALAVAHHPVLKIKMGSAQDIALLQAVREVAPQARLRVDANEGWSTKEEALRKLEWLAQDPLIELVEQPMPAHRPLADWIWLKQRSPLPIFADESCLTAADVPRLVDAFHGVNVKLVKAGGLSGARAALQAARRHGLRTMLGCMIESSLLISAAAHLANLCDYLDLDGNLLIENDPFLGVTQDAGWLTFARSPEPWGLRVAPRPGTLWSSWMANSSPADRQRAGSFRANAGEPSSSHLPS